MPRRRISRKLRKLLLASRKAVAAERELRAAELLELTTPPARRKQNA